MGQHNLPGDLMSKGAEFPASGRGFNVNGIGFLLAWGTTVPSDAATGYGTGCLFIHTDGATSSTVLYVNIGSKTSCNFDAITGA